jgi:hypothetical protein
VRPRLHWEICALRGDRFLTRIFQRESVRYRKDISRGGSGEGIILRFDNPDVVKWGAMRKPEGDHAEILDYWRAEAKQR